MPPRIPIFQCLRAPNATFTSSSRSFTSSAPCQAAKSGHRRKHRDPYAIAQAKARKAANLSRQQVLKQERAAALGDPVRGTTTPYVESFDTALPPEPSPPSASTRARIDASPDVDAEGPKADKDKHLNFFLSRDELERGLTHSKWLSTPPKEAEAKQARNVDLAVKQDEHDDQTLGLSRRYETESGAEKRKTREDEEAKRRAQQTTAEEALRRISSLSLASGGDRLRVNKMRCIEDFGRHTTDGILPPKAPSSTGRPRSLPEKTPRAGPDTGSSEVQVAILTAKIRSLDQFLQGRGTQDKNGKRDLRLLVHRRQKLLRYLRRKERGGPRWQNLIEKLGLTEGTWKGEISLA